MGPDAVCAIYRDAAAARGWGASLGDSFIQGVWSKVAMRGGLDSKELWALRDALSNWHELAKRKLVLVRVDNAAAVAYANHGAGPAGQSTRLAREIKESGIRCECSVVALRVAGKDTAVADAVSRFLIEATGGKPYPGRELRPKFRAMVVDHWGPMDVDLMSDDRGVNAERAQFSSPAMSAFEGRLPSGQLWWFPHIDLIDLTLGRVIRAIKDDWAGARVRPLPVQPLKGSSPKLSGIKRVRRWTSDSALVLDRSGGYPRRTPNEGNADWVVMSMSKRALGGIFCNGHVGNR